MPLLKHAFELGLFAQAIVFPTVPKGKARIRTIMTAQHSKEELDKALEIIQTGAKKRVCFKLIDFF